MGNLEKQIVQMTEKLFSPVGGLLDAENELINLRTRNTPADLTRQRVISEIYLSKHLQTAVIKTIASNEKLACSTNKHAIAMRWLTAALVFVGVVQVVWPLLFKIIWYP